MAANEGPSTQEAPDLRKKESKNENDDEVHLSASLPEPVRKCTDAICRVTSSVFNCLKTAIWVAGISSLILFGPLIFEVELAQLQESNRRNQKQFLPSAPSYVDDLSPDIAVAR